MKSLKRLLPLLLVLALLLLTTLPVYAADTGFSDVNASDWYYSNVMTLVEKGIVSGYSDGTFKPKNNLTGYEALKLTMNAVDLEPYDCGDSAAWYAGYMLCAVDLGIIETSFKGTSYITRAQVAQMLTTALEVQKGITANTAVLGYFTDTNSIYAETLKDLGIVNGTQDSSGTYTFNPDAKITRAEICALVVRTNDYYENGLSSASAATNAFVKADSSGVLTSPVDSNEMANISQPKTYEQWRQKLMYEVYNMQSSFTVPYNMAYDNIIASEILTNFGDAYNSLFYSCPEYFSLFSGASYTLDGNSIGCTVTVNFYNQQSNGYHDTVDFVAKQKTYIEDTEKALKGLLDDGYLRSGMSQAEMAYVIYAWVCENVEYKYDAEQWDCFNGYGFFTNGTAVCQGYTSVYNLMCRYVGIEVQGMTGVSGQAATNGIDNHIWTAQILDGVRVLTDVTWGDQGGIDDGAWTSEWFAGSAEKFLEKHSWDESEYADWADAPGLDWTYYNPFDIA